MPHLTHCHFEHHSLLVPWTSGEAEASGWSEPALGIGEGVGKGLSSRRVLQQQIFGRGVVWVLYRRLGRCLPR